MTGVPSTFIRASGCNLRCSWCDTPYASWNPEGDDIPVPQLLDRVDSFGAKHVVLTGGEPMIMPDLAPLCEAIKSRGHHITIETAATVFLPLPIDLASLSPKLANSTPRGTVHEASHEARRMNIPVIQSFIDHAPDFQLKFVASQESDVAEIRGVLDQLRNWEPADVQLMPEGTDQATLDRRAGWITEICKKEGFRYSPRLHIALFGNRRGT